MRRQRRAQMGDGLSIGSGLVAADVEAGLATAGSIARPVLIGVCTGVSVWLATRILDRLFGIEKRGTK